MERTWFLDVLNLQGDIYINSVASERESEGKMGVVTVYCTLVYFSVQS